MKGSDNVHIQYTMSDTFHIVILQYIHTKSDMELTVTMTQVNVLYFDLIQSNSVIYMVGQYLIVNSIIIL